MRKREYILIVMLTLIAMCTQQKTIRTMDNGNIQLRGAEIANDVFVNSLFAYITYREHGFWPSSCEHLENTLPDSVIFRYAGKNVCTDLFKYDHEGEEKGVNWDIMQITTYKLNGDSSITATVNEMEKTITFEVPLSGLDMEFTK